MKCWHRLNLQYSSPSHKVLFTVENQNGDDWFINSGASSHMTPYIENLEHLVIHEGEAQVTIGDEYALPIAHLDKGIIESSARKLHLHNLFHVPIALFHLVSISRLITDNDVSIMFDHHGYTIKDNKTIKAIIQGG